MSDIKKGFNSPFLWSAGSVPVAAETRLYLVDGDAVAGAERGVKLPVAFEAISSRFRIFGRDDVDGAEVDVVLGERLAHLVDELVLFCHRRGGEQEEEEEPGWR